MTFEEFNAPIKITSVKFSSDMYGYDSSTKTLNFDEIDQKLEEDFPDEFEDYIKKRNKYL